MRDFLSFEPLYQERIWGGRALEAFPGRSLPPSRPIGESWEIVDRPEAQSVVDEGPLRGTTLRSLIEEDPSAMMGPGWPAAKAFPILVKWLDCRERLKLQVHPPAELAGALGGEPKTENWYIAQADPGAHLLVGLRPGTTRGKFEVALAAGTAEACVRRFHVCAGDSILVRSGEVHAIDAGNLILEIQQNSDTTYRVYDWGRLGLDGKPRALHIEPSLRSIRWDGPPPEPVKAGPDAAVLADCPEFRLRRLPLAAGARLDLPAGEQPRIVSVVSGRVVSGGGRRAERGANLLAPCGCRLALKAEVSSMVLVTDNFARA